MKAEGYSERKDCLAGWPVRIVSYRLGNRYHVSIHNEEPGAWIARAFGSTLVEAESKARKEAEEALAKVRRHPTSAGCKSDSGG
jgi:hypothetical protein